MRTIYGQEQVDTVADLTAAAHSCYHYSAPGLSTSGFLSTCSKHSEGQLVCLSLALTALRDRDVFMYLCCRNYWQPTWGGGGGGGGGAPGSDQYRG